MDPLLGFANPARIDSERWFNAGEISVKNGLHPNDSALVFSCMLFKGSKLRLLTTLRH